MFCEGRCERNITLSPDLYAQRTQTLMKSADGGILCNLVSHCHFKEGTTLKGHSTQFVLVPEHRPC